MQAAAKERRRLDREARAEQRKADKLHKDEERIWLKEEEKWHKLRSAEGELVELPAVVLRNGTVKAVGKVTAVETLDLYLDAMCLDVETSGYWIGHQYYELRTVQLGGEEVAVVLDAGDPDQMAIASYALNAARKLHAHSASADVIPCVVAGLIDWDSAWGKMHDSVLYAKLTDPKLSGSEADKLKELASDLLREYAVAPFAEKAKNELFKAMGCKLKLEATDSREVNGWYKVNRFSETMIRYAGSDVLDLAGVLRVLPSVAQAYTFPFDDPDARKLTAEQVIEREREFQGICARPAMVGFALDADHIKTKIAEHEASKTGHLSNLAILTDGKITNPSTSGTGATILELWPELAGKLEVSEKTGEPSAGKKSLANLKEDEVDPYAYQSAQEILAYRHDVTSLGLLLRPLENLCDQGDARMRPTVYTINANTGRCSCVRPNGQQFSRRGGIRKSVCADCGYVMVNADFEGCEIRVAAALSGDKGLYEAETGTQCHACGCDPCDTNCGKQHTGLHWLAAHLTFGPDAVKENRYKAKAVIFRKLFGGAPDSEVAQKISDVFDTQIAPVYAAWDKWLRNCYYEGSVVWRDFRLGENFRYDIPGERRRGIYRAYSGRQIYINAPHAFGNYAIQGTARELLVDGMTRFWGKIQQHPQWGIAALLPIHDEVFGWVKQEYHAEATQALRESMETDVLSSSGFPVQIGADPELKQYTYWPDSS
jgi:hypothetical protein